MRGRDRDRDRDRDRAPRGPRVDIGDLLTFITKSLVSAPQEVDVALVEERDAYVYEIEVGDDDLGTIIGRGGKTARAIRTVVSAVAPRTGKRTIVEILE